jgi:hypothetical protein
LPFGENLTWFDHCKTCMSATAKRCLMFEIACGEAGQFELGRIAVSRIIAVMRGSYNILPTYMPGFCPISFWPIRIMVRSLPHLLSGCGIRRLLMPPRASQERPVCHPISGRVGVCRAVPYTCAL